MRVRAGPYAQIRQVAPVRQVVVATHPRQRPVGYFVVPIARLPHRILRHNIHIRRQVRVRLRHPPVRYPALHWRAALQRQAVHRQVRRRKLKRPVKRPPPLLQTLARQPIHQINADVGKARIRRHAIGVRRRRRAVPPAQRCKQPVVKALNAYAQPVHAAIQVRAELVRREVPRICLQRNLSVRQNAKRRADCPHHARYILRRQIRRRPAPEEHAAHSPRITRARRRKPAPQRDFGSQRIPVGGHQRLYRGVCVEVAVRAFGFAERDMHIQRDFGGGIRHSI